MSYRGFSLFRVAAINGICSVRTPGFGPCLFFRRRQFKPNHNASKGYIAMYTIKAVTEKVGKVDRKAFAQAMKNVRLSAKDYPGILMDLAYDDKGDLDRESFLVEVTDGKQVVIETLPPLNPAKK